jgi:hypothetical protein
MSAALRARLARLEQARADAVPLLPALVLFVHDDATAARRAFIEKHGCPPQDVVVIERRCARIRTQVACE